MLINQYIKLYYMVKKERFNIFLMLAFYFYYLKMMQHFANTFIAKTEVILASFLTSKISYMCLYHRSRLIFTNILIIISLFTVFFLQ